MNRGGGPEHHLPHLTAWVLSDGKAGDEAQCLGVAEALGMVPEIRRVAPRPPFSWLMPFGPIDPREAPSRPAGPLAAPFPDLLVASGRRAVPYVRAVKRASGRRTFTVILKDPRTGPAAADLIWVPEHDRLRGPNVLATLTSPHRVSAARLAGARARPDPRLAGLPRPRVAVLAGGDSRHHRFTADDVARFTGDLRRLAGTGASLMITASRRTPAALREALQDLAGERGFFWDGRRRQPLPRHAGLGRRRRRDGRFRQYGRRGGGDGRAHPPVRALGRAPEAVGLHRRPRTPRGCEALRGQA